MRRALRWALIAALALLAARALNRSLGPLRAKRARSIVWTIDDSYQSMIQLIGLGAPDSEIAAAEEAMVWGIRWMMPVALRLDPTVLERFPAHLEWAHPAEEELRMQLTSAGGDALTLVSRRS